MAYTDTKATRHTIGACEVHPSSSGFFEKQSTDARRPCELFAVILEMLHEIPTNPEP
jgi:hypothetical protein